MYNVSIGCHRDNKEIMILLKISNLAWVFATSNKKIIIIAKYKYEG